ncbi:MAG: alanine--tRNA ligase [Candidatus Marinimicrobia bacterium]|nr:alanine--tRNA ligase [Candidatus Neomarinimicrobiota bacterium]
MKSSQIRESFISFFESKSHARVPSAPVLPIGDKSLLFTNAGMNQFKAIFLNTEEPKDLRVANSQKCIRVSGKHNDLEEVGRDGFHHTFFEMLGNWSFGDYYKKEAIEWSWELFTKVWKLDKSRLWVTVYEEDDEAFDLWKTQTDIDPNRIIRSGAKDNFWEMAETGPCGPCSEIHYYVGSNPTDQQAELVNNSSEYWELWNLVFIQFNRLKDGNMEDLPKKHVDTGAGLERICSVLQNKDSNYKTDLFSKTIEDLENFSNTKYQDFEVSYNVICDHIRMLSFAIADGVIPSNDGRGYVLRRVLRRGSKFAMNLEIKEPILYKLVDSVVSTMSSHYPELKEKQEYIEQTILSEEQSFLRTLENGVIQFEKIVSSTSGSEIHGKDAFKLYDTYGFPLDLTQLMAEERKMTVDIDGFDVEMKNQKELAKSGQKFEMDNLHLKWNLETKSSHSIFVGYENESISSKIINHAESGDDIIIILENTPFYSESGGQIGDTGIIKNDDFSARVNDTQKNGDYVLHICTLTNGAIGDNLSVDCMIDADRRNNIKLNHTATHLLHQSLKDVLGSHVNQAGSLVHPEYLRFDITHPNKISSKELESIELIVNQKIDDNITVETSIKSLEEAKKEGASALFGEKYGDQVRVVTIGEFSKELCGGTHVTSTGKIHKFKIKHDKAISSGIRRINAVTHNQVDLYLKENLEVLGLQKKAEQKKAEEKQSQSILLDSVNVDLIVSKPIKEINGTHLFFSKAELGIASDLKSLNKKIKSKIDSGIIFLFTEIENKTTISVGISDDLIAKNLKAGDLVKSIALELQGGGGGREDFAMAGIPHTNADDLKAVVEKIILSILEEI